MRLQQYLKKNREQSSPLWRFVGPYNRPNIGFITAGPNGAAFATRSIRPLGLLNKSRLRIRFDNRYFNNTGGMTDGDEITVVGGWYLEYNGVSRAVSVNGSTGTFVIPKGAMDFQSDDILPSLFGLSEFDYTLTAIIRSDPHVAPGAVYAVLTGTDTGGTEAKQYDPTTAAFTNLSGTGSTNVNGTGGTSVQGAGLQLIGVNIGEDPKTSLLCGDSIFTQGNNTSYGVVALKGAGAPNYISGMQFGRLGSVASIMELYPDYFASINKYCNMAIYEFGTNSVSSSTLSQLQSRDQSAIALIRSKIFNHPLARPYKIIGTFITPRTTGSWSTDAGQTVVSKYEVGGIVDQLNAWRVTQVGTLFDAVVDQRQGPAGTILSAVPPAVNSDKWANPGSLVPTAGVFTNDGLHPISAPANIMGGNLRPVIDAL